VEVNQVGNRRRKLKRRADGRALQAMIHVGGRFVGPEGLQVVADRDPLAQLLELRPRH
jgi:hypothetical protein